MTSAEGGRNAAGRPSLWFERVYARVGLPFWAGAILVGYVPFIAGLIVGYQVAGLWDEFLSQLLTVHIPVAIGVFTSQLGATYVCDRVERLREYARTMAEGDARIDVGPIYRLRWLLVVWLFLNVFGNGAYVISAGAKYTTSQLLLTQVSTWPIMILFLATFIWVFVGSMVAIYRMGQLPLRLRPFTEDRMLGLGPFARESLWLTAIYLVLVAEIAFPQILSGAFGLPVAVMFLAFFPLALAFFLLPLLPLRRKLREAKSEKLRWIGSEYSKVMRSVETINGGVDELTAGRLMAIDKIQRDIRQIRTWPFETGILARLAAIVVSVTAILLASIVRLAIGI